jgi:hypothetical protein
LRIDKIPHRLLQHFFYAVTQQTRWNGIDGQEPALQIMRAQQVMAVLDQIAVPVFGILFHAVPQRVRRSGRILRKQDLPLFGVC